MNPDVLITIVFSSFVFLVGVAGAVGAGVRAGRGHRQRDLSRDRRAEEVGARGATAAGVLAARDAAAARIGSSDAEATTARDGSWGAKSTAAAIFAVTSVALG